MVTLRPGFIGATVLAALSHAARVWRQGAGHSRGSELPTLRIIPTALSANKYRVDLALAMDGVVRKASSQLEFASSPQQEEALRWYLEDFLKAPYPPAPTLARRVEKDSHELGARLFDEVFQSNEDARQIAKQFLARLGETRIEIETDASYATTVPWELICEPKTGLPLACGARAFVRAPAYDVDSRASPRNDTETGEIRLLLIICRPGGRQDVPFRSVATRLLHGLSETAPGLISVDALRPPTFARLVEVLRTARASGRPYQIVHFDGHGAYLDLMGANKKRGYLLFEQPDQPGNERLVHGGMLVVLPHSGGQIR